MVSVTSDVPPSNIPVSPKTPNSTKRDQESNETEKDEDNKGAVNGFTNGIVVLSFVTVLTYLIY